MKVGEPCRRWSRGSVREMSREDKAEANKIKLNLYVPWKVPL